jgi:hypothetical protein
VALVDVLQVDVTSVRHAFSEIRFNFQRVQRFI